ncbi:Ig-like domain-containing protein, partial [Paraburkholderia sp. SIMBA_053]|uniref:Ig-like domain-containing protein n=1 Tax=Paraburkholderia sp. SIMBA_053 TaxID=3085794 RepID=UPI00397A9DAC
TITPTATDPAGNSTAGDPIDVTVDTVASPAPVIPGPADGAVVTDATPTFSGTGDDGDTITVTDGDGNVLCTTTVVDGEWSCTPTD